MTIEPGDTIFLVHHENDYEDPILLAVLDISENGLYSLFNPHDGAEGKHLQMQLVDGLLHDEEEPNPELCYYEIQFVEPKGSSHLLQAEVA